MESSDAGHDTSEKTDVATPIWISRRTRRVLVVGGLAALALLVWRVPTLLSLSAGGAALAIALSFPVRRFSRVMPRGAAITLTMVLGVGLVVVAITVVAPIIAAQLHAFVAAVPGIVRQLDERVPTGLDWLAGHGLLPDSPDHVLADIQQRLLATIQQFAGRLLGSLGQLVSGLAGVVIAMLGIVLVAVYMLADTRRIQATVLRASPHRYRRDVHALWDTLGQTLSRYLAGLALSTGIEGALAAIAFHALGVPYAFLLGAWVTVTAVIPYVGAWIGYAPGVLLAFAISPSRALLSVAVCLLINMVVGNAITPRIQGRAVHLHPMIVFFAAIVGGELFGMPGVFLAVPTMAVLRVFYDFLRIRVRVVDSAAQPAPSLRAARAGASRSDAYGSGPSLGRIRPARDHG